MFIYIIVHIHSGRRISLSWGTVLHIHMSVAYTPINIKMPVHTRTHESHTCP